MEKFNLIPVGVVRHLEEETFLEIYPEFADAIEGLNEGDWIKLILWFHESDNPERRKILKVHPYNNPENPLRGVFATRSPVRPNPLALYTVQIHRIEGNTLFIDWIDAHDGTPIVDIKIFVERLDCPIQREVDEKEVDIWGARQIGEINLIPRGDELEEVKPEEYTALIVELGEKTTYLNAAELVELINALNEIYEELPVEIKDKLKGLGKSL